MASRIRSVPFVAAATPPSANNAVQNGTRQQSISIKPSPSATSPDPLIPTSLTTKQWVIPPRPKPGRKPATDTPPTKRKAQNRAAQRAFRERRAARVGELEEHIKKIEDEDEQEQTVLREHISELDANLQRYRGEMNMWIERCHTLEKELAAEKTARETLLRDLGASQKGGPTSATIVSKRTLGTSPQTTTSNQQQEELVGCGGCSSTSRCECVEAALDIPDMNDHDAGNGSKRPHSPSLHDSNRRIKLEPAENHSMEIDFTQAFANGVQPGSQVSFLPVDVASPSSVVADPCGFCQDGTPCICAEMAASDAQPPMRRQSTAASNQLPAIRRISQFTPPPSDGDVALPSKNQENPAASNSCSNGPGTCAQCLADPNSTLFCKTLSTARGLSQLPEGTANSGGCCGGRNNGQSCCQSQIPSSRSLPLPTRRTRSHITTQEPHTAQTPLSSIKLSCADAYTTLSRHPNYERAISSGEVASWMPKLYASPARDSESSSRHGAKDKLATMETPAAAVSSSSGRPAMEIEVANVMSVLREFDRRFGSNA